MPEDLRTALHSTLAATPVDLLGRTVTQLIEAYRSGRAPSTPILANALDAAAYAAYRMPATYAAVAAALRAMAAASPGFAPLSLLDLGGGTGAAAWACAARLPSVQTITVADQSGDALTLGRELAKSSSLTAVRLASWQRLRLGADAALPAADLVTISYVLGELSPDSGSSLVAKAATLGGAVLVVEPGTPAGYDRIMAARAVLVESGLRITAPCPHSGACPLVPRDWCHFGARVNRSSLHRQLKSGSLSYEDEKFSYVAALPARAPAWLPADASDRLRTDACAGWARVLRRPMQRKGLVSLRLCRPDGAVGEQIVTRRLGADIYRAARDVEWGDEWF